MILTIPYNPNLPGGYDRLTGSILRLGKYPSHTLAVVAKAQHEDAAFDFAMKIHGQFGRYLAVTVPDAQEMMLAASNRMFLAALDMLWDYAPTEHEMPDPAMFYFDPSWRPTKQRWLDEFNTEYYLAGAPTTFGCFNEQKPVGPVVIKQDFLKKSKLLGFLPGAGAHWRDFLAWEIINNGVNTEALGRTLPAYIRPFDS